MKQTVTKLFIAVLLLSQLPLQLIAGDNLKIVPTVGAIAALGGGYLVWDGCLSRCLAKPATGTKTAIDITKTLCGALLIGPGLVALASYFNHCKLTIGTVISSALITGGTPPALSWLSDKSSNDWILTMWPTMIGCVAILGGGGMFYYANK